MAEPAPNIPIVNVSHDEIVLTPFKFESEGGKSDDVWAFYRCLMRGFLLATYEQELETINANPSANKDDNDNNRLIILGQIGRLLRGMDKSVLHIDNVFQFDEFAITECDLIVGMLTRISRWFKHKVQLDVPRQYFSDIDTSKVALESSADYFVHQIDSAFKDLKHKTPDPTIEVKDIDNFIDHLTTDMKNAGRSKVLAAYDAVRGSITAEKARAAAGKVTRKVRLVIDKTRQVGNTAVEGVKKFTRGRQLAYREWDAKRQSEKSEKADQALADIKAQQQVPLQQQHGGAPGKPGIDLLYPLKQYRELRATGEIEVMQKPNMTAVEYFEKLPVMLTRMGATGNDQVFPALFGHPLLLYLPFARAFGCVIEVYSRPSFDNKDPVLKYLFPSKSEITKSTFSMPIIRIMDDNPYNHDPHLKDVLVYPNFLTYQDQYLANFSLFLPSGGSEVADKAVKYLAKKVKLSSQMQANGDKLQQFKDQYNIADAKYKDANSLMLKAEKAMDSSAKASQNESTQKQATTKEVKVYNTAKQANDAAHKRLLVTQNRLNDMISKIKSQNAENDRTADGERQAVINVLPAYKVPTPYVKQSAPAASAPSAPAPPSVKPPAPAVISTASPSAVITSGPVTSTPPAVISPVISTPAPSLSKASALAPAAAPVVIPAPAKAVAPAPPAKAVAPAPPSAPVTSAPVTSAPVTSAPVKTVAPAPVKEPPAPAPSAKPPAPSANPPAPSANPPAPAPSANPPAPAPSANPPAPLAKAPAKPSPPPATAPKPASPLKLKIMTFNVCREALSAIDFASYCKDGHNNECINNIQNAILHRMAPGKTVIFLQECLDDFNLFFNNTGTISDSSGHPSKIFTYTLNAAPSKKFHVYSTKPCSETIITICPTDIFPNRADRCFMGNLMGSPFKNSYDSNNGGYLQVQWTLMPGCRPYIVLVFNAQRLILINVHSHHNRNFSQGTKSYTQTQTAEMNRLNSVYGNMQKYAFTELKKMLETEIPTEFKDYHIIIGGDFNSVTEARSKEMLGFLGMNIGAVTTNNPSQHTVPTCSGNDMTQYTTVNDHIYSNNLKVSEYSVHPVNSLQKDTNSKFLFSDHLPVYATIEMPS